MGEEERKRERGENKWNKERERVRRREQMGEEEMNKGRERVEKT